jgi:PAZ domain
LLYSKEALEKSIVEALRNQIVVTGYSNEVYTIVGVDFSLLPTSYRGKQSFVDLLRDRFKVEIGNLEQPMLIAENEH